MKKSRYPVERHNSQRGWFAAEIYEHMMKNKNVWLIVGDLGYKMFDHHFRDFPERTLNVGAAEQSMMGIAVGLALSGKIPFVYSITTFLLYRPFETIRTYIDYESIPVKLIGSGRNKDYFHDGISHWSEDDKLIMRNFKNIKSVWPKHKEEIPQIISEMIKDKIPWYVNLMR